jgi:phloretin hydrolase
MPRCELTVEISSLYTATVTREIGSLIIPVNVFMHCVRQADGGVEYRSRYWLGWTINKKGELVKSGLPFPKNFMLNMARNNCIHSLTEYNNLASILPSLYKEQRGRIE